MNEIPNPHQSTNSIVRQLKIDLITDEANPIIEWFNDLWNTLCIMETNVYHKDGGEIIYYVVNSLGKQWIFYQDDKNERFWCNYNHYWTFLENKFPINYTDTQDITKLLVDNALNNSVATPIKDFNDLRNKVDNALNNSVATPLDALHFEGQKVDNALMKNVAIPSPQNTSRHIPNTVDDILSKSVATPHEVRNLHLPKVTNVLNNSVGTPQDAKGDHWSKVDNAFKDSTALSIDVLKDGYVVDNSLNNINVVSVATPAFVDVKLDEWVDNSLNKYTNE